jgi:crotonobetainyl-CoA:carnitine CoA-transferase CaiB-like acyl-CoA transferase
VTPAGPVPYRIGQHTNAVLGQWLGYSPERIAALADQKVVALG